MQPWMRQGGTWRSTGLERHDTWRILHITSHAELAASRELVKVYPGTPAAG